MLSRSPRINGWWKTEAAEILLVSFSVVMSAISAGLIAWTDSQPAIVAAVLGLALFPVVMRYPELIVAYVTLDYVLFDILDFRFFSVLTVSMVALLFSLIYLLGRWRLLWKHGDLKGIPAQSKTLLASVGLFWIYITVSGINSGYFELTLLAYPLFFLMCFCWLRERGQSDVIPWIFIIVSSYLALTGFLELFLHGFGSQGVSSFLSNHVMPSFYSWLGLPFAWYMARKQAKGLRRTFFYGLCLLFLGRVLIGGSLGVMMVVTPAIFLLIWHDRRLFNWLVLASLFVIVLSPLAQGTLAGFGNRLIDLASGDSDRVVSSTSGRVLALEAAWNIFRANPTWGLGYGRMRVNWGQYVTSWDIRNTDTTQELPAHSSFLTVAADLGIIGLVIYSFLFLYSLYILYKAYSRCPVKNPKKYLLFAYLVVFLSFFIHGMIDNTGLHDKAFYLMIACSMWLRPS